jgi:hypothetical protein
VGVFCVEEKIQIQALGCKNPVPPLSAASRSIPFNRFTRAEISSIRLQSVDKR